MKLKLILCYFILQLAYGFVLEDKTGKLGQAHYFNQENLKDKAFTVLQEKCNVCHSTKRKTDIFTLANMDSLAANIQKQVFVKRKMPKGRKGKLTEEEELHLKVWLDDTLDNN